MASRYDELYLYGYIDIVSLFAITFLKIFYLRDVFDKRGLCLSIYRDSFPILRIVIYIYIKISIAKINNNLYTLITVVFYILSSIIILRVL